MQDNTNNAKCIGNIYSKDFSTGYAGNVWAKNGLCPTLRTFQGGNAQPMIVVEYGRSKREILQTSDTNLK